MGDVEIKVPTFTPPDSTPKNMLYKLSVYSVRGAETFLINVYLSESEEDLVQRAKGHHKHNQNYLCVLHKYTHSEVTTVR